jgi:DNA ligase (NAD+)
MSTSIINAPTQCPDCNSAIVEYTEPKSSITTHWCENALCPGRVADMLTHIADRKLLEIEGLGPEMAATLAKAGYITNIADLFEFLNECAFALSKHGEDKFSTVMKKRGLSAAAVLNMIETAERAKTAGWDRWIAALGIPMIGITLGKVIAKERKLTSEGMLSLPMKLYLPTLTRDHEEIEGVGFHKRAELNKFALDAEGSLICQRLYTAGVRPTPVEQPAVVEGSPLDKVAFCITGEFYEIGSREYITTQLVKLGAVSKSGVTKKVTHLLVGTEPGQTKLKKAADLKIPTYDTDWISEQFVKYGLKAAGGALDVEWAD